MFDKDGGETGWAVHHVHQPGCVAGGIGARKYPAGQVDAPVVLEFVSSHPEHMSHGSIEAINATVTVGVVGARYDCPHAMRLVHGKSPLGEELQPIMG